ncbi:MAG: phosphoribosyltransferase family protein [Deltaproteobacteria bacterium]|nr:phosphoribosyltransferase family protein [Deltaproteobacteria bacterium]
MTKRHLTHKPQKPHGLKPFINASGIKKIVRSLGRRIKKDYSGRRPVFVGVLRGSFMFTADMAREVGGFAEIAFISISCYGKNNKPLKKARVKSAVGLDIRGRDVIVVEDILDRGVTIKALLAFIKSKNPASISVCALFVRSGRPAYKPRYIGKTIGKGFVVGYGMDYKDDFRCLPEIYVLKGASPYE